MDTYKLDALLEKHEGRSPYIYSDSGGTCTVGVGHALFTVGMTQDLPFFSEGALAQRDQIAEAWHRVKRTREADKSMCLRDGAIDSLLESDRNKALAVAKRTFPQFDTYPECVQLALGDMGFNLGSFVEFPRFSAAVRSGNWTVAAQECRRIGVGETRNRDTQRLILQAKNGAENVQK